MTWRKLSEVIIQKYRFVFKLIDRLLLALRPVAILLCIFRTILLLRQKMRQDEFQNNKNIRVFVTNILLHVHINSSVNLYYICCQLLTLINTWIILQKICIWYMYALNHWWNNWNFYLAFFEKNINSNAKFSWNKNK